ncbi:MAG: type IA DNA topoisomerase, partial [Eubacterium sp.]|nr:type IA DNA topoisomerase [Eubacterium sp.]
MADKALFIAEKPSVAREFAAALHEKMQKYDGYMESDHAVVTWCVGHLVTMSYPDAYDPALKKWSFDTLPFLPETFRYEVIKDVRKQFDIVKNLLLRKDVGTIYVCTDSGREGEYIYRLVAQMAKVPEGTVQKRVWIDSQTEEEILRGIREAKDLSEYDHLSDAAYLRAKEDYLMGINFSRALSIRYAGEITDFLGKKYQAVSVGRVMTCVLGMVVRREREIRNFVKTPFFRVLSDYSAEGAVFEGEWRVVPGSRYEGHPCLYKENGFRERKDAEDLIAWLKEDAGKAEVIKVEKKTQKKNPPLLYNLAELQNDGSRHLKISPDATLQIVQELYEKKLVTYPRTDARVLSSAIAKEIGKNLKGLCGYDKLSWAAEEILSGEMWKKIGKSRYTDDKQVTDHYAIIPTGQGLSALRSLKPPAALVYEMIVRRFLSIFYPPAVYRKITLEAAVKTEHFFSSFNILKEEGYRKISVMSFPGPGQTTRKSEEAVQERGDAPSAAEADEDGMQAGKDPAAEQALMKLQKGSLLELKGFRIKEGETHPPKRYTSGSMILAMENAGQLIEDEELREQIRGSGIGTSATRAEILKKLVLIKYLALQNKTQVITPTQMGEMVYEVVNASVR